MVAMAEEKVREDRLRRVAARRGYRLVKAKRMDTGAIDYGRWEIRDLFTDELVAGRLASRDALTTDEVEEWLNR